MTGSDQISPIKFSIGIPAFKVKFLKECIASILNQSYTHFELIIVDDHSPDNIKAVVDQFADSRINYYRNDKNTGAEHVVNNWNICLEKATGDFFVLMGDDDKMGPDYLEEFAALIKKYPDLDVYHCRTRIINDYNKDIILTPSWPEYENVYDSIWHRITERRLQYISDFVYRTSALKAQGGYFYLPLAWGSDEISAYRASINKGIAHTNKPVFYYRSNTLSITSTGNDLLKMEANLLYEKWLRTFFKTAPTDELALITYNDLNKFLSKILQKRKVLLMSKSMNIDSLKKAKMWYKNRGKFGINNKEILFAMLNSFKSKVAKNHYDN